MCFPSVVFYFKKNVQNDKYLIPENEPKEVFLILKCVIFGEPQNRGYFREILFRFTIRKCTKMLLKTLKSECWNLCRQMDR